MTDVYTYDDIPNKVRVQIIHIISGAIGPYSPSYPASPGVPLYEQIVRTMRKEHGVFELSPAYGQIDKELFDWMLKERDIDALLDAIEYTFWLINEVIPGNQFEFREYATISPENATAELNARLLEASIGYQFEGGNIIKFTSHILHTEVVVPALTLISDPSYVSVDKEFRAAHGAFRAADYETALVECLKAFESTLKVIGAERNWSIAPTDTANKLLASAYAANFIPSWMQAEFTSLRALLESSIPTVRNKMAGHGSGTVQRSVSRELAAFQIHQTAACIVFLIEHHKAIQ